MHTFYSCLWQDLDPGHPIREQGGTTRPNDYSYIMGGIITICKCELFLFLLVVESWGTILVYI